MIVQGIECPLCKAQIWSRSHHDFRHCPCGYCFVDGGRSYLRWGYGGDKFPQPWKLPKTVDIDTTDERTK